MAVADRLHFTDSDEANELIAREPLALLIGFALDQQVTVPTAFQGPLKLKQRIGTLDAHGARADRPGGARTAFRERPAIHRFPGAMAKRVHELAAVVDDGVRRRRGPALERGRRRRRAPQPDRSLPGFGRDEGEGAGQRRWPSGSASAAADGLVPNHPTLGDVDSRGGARALPGHEARVQGQAQGPVRLSRYLRRHGRPPRRPGRCALALSGASAQALRLPAAPKCPVFPAKNPWNQRVDRLPVAADSDAIVRSIGVGDHVHADFGSGLWDGGPIGIPITVVGRKTPRSRVSASSTHRSRTRVRTRSRAASRSRAGRTRTATATRSSSTRTSCKLYELFVSLYPKARRRLARRLGRDLRPALEPRPPGRLDLGRCGRAADLPRPCALRRGQARPDRPRAALHRLAHAPRLRLPRPPLRERPHRPVAAADGPARPPEGELRHAAVSRARRGSCSRR